MIGGLIEFLTTHQSALWQRMVEHLDLMFVALVAAGIVGIPAGIVAARVRVLATPFLTMANIVQTIPSVALLGFLLPVLGIGKATASVALFLYALLPIMRNTITGLRGVDPGVVDAARGMGMSARQVLMRVELPLASPVIFAGVRTAAVINVGVTTLAALIGAGGLGTFIFRGLATNNTATILLGAVPAALLALTADGLLAACERLLHRFRAGFFAVGAVVAAIIVAVWMWPSGSARMNPAEITFGVTAEFMERADGFEAWRRHYGAGEVRTRELDPGLLYEALKRGKVDVACGFSTDGRIPAFSLRPLSDDLGFFPVYEAAWLIRSGTLEKFPAVGALVSKLEGALDQRTMQRLNARVDLDKLPPARAVSEFLEEWAPRHGVDWSPALAGAKAADPAAPTDLTIGTKNFTEQYILGQLLRQLINGATPLRAGLKQGLGGTSVCFQALERGDIDVYPEYSGTLLSSVLRPSDAEFDVLARDRAAAGAYLREGLLSRFGLHWIAPLGFSNTYAMLVRSDHADLSEVRTISELLRGRSGVKSGNSR